MTPSTRMRTAICFACGSKWRSEAPSSMARAISELTSAIAGAVVGRRRGCRDAGSSPSKPLAPTAVVRTMCAVDRREQVRSRGDGDAQTLRPSARRRWSEATTFVGSRHGDEHEILVRKRIGQRLVAARELLRQQRRRRGVDRHRREVEILETVLLRKQPRDARGGHPALGERRSRRAGARSAPSPRAPARAAPP